MLALFKLGVIADFDIIDPFSNMQGFVILAGSEEEARTAAVDRCRELDRPSDLWLDPALTFCAEVDVSSPGVVMELGPDT